MKAGVRSSRQTDREGQRRRAVDKLLAAVRYNKPAETLLLEYLKDYCEVAFQKGFDAGYRLGRRGGGW